MVATSNTRLALVGGTLIDGTGAAPVTGKALLIEGERLRLAFAGEIPADYSVVDLSGKWVVPGLIDCHVHLIGESTLDAYRRYVTPEPSRRLLNAAKDMANMLHTGFTTVRQLGLGYGVALREATRLGLLRGPRILAANTALTSTGGHGDWAIYPEAWVRSWPPEFRGTIVDGEEECRKAVRRSFREGADLIKLMTSAGGITNHPHDLIAHGEFSPSELRAIVSEARRWHRKVAAHAVGNAGVRLAVDAGVDTIEHGVFEPDPAVIEDMAHRGIVLVPTLFIFSWVIEEGREAGVFEEGIEAAKRLMDLQFRAVSAAHAGGVRVALGTDDNGVLGAGRHGRELQLLCHAGLSARAAITAGTQNGAVACGLEHEIGTLESGKAADVIVLSRDPLADVSSLAQEGSVEMVIQSKLAS